jgi:hypothetical protein
MSAEAVPSFHPQTAKLTAVEAESDESQHTLHLLVLTLTTPTIDLMKWERIRLLSYEYLTSCGMR